MLPRDLKPQHFRAYPERARKLVVDHLDALKRLPLSFLPSLLREAMAYDWKFPVERRHLDKEVAVLSSLSSGQLEMWFEGFTQIRLSSNFEHLDWVNAPGEFVEQLSAYLWTTHQLDAFRTAAVTYADHLQVAAPPEAPPIPRLGIAVIGQGVAENSYSLFRKLRPHGVYFSLVRPENGLKVLLDAVADRAQQHPAPYGHWYIDGGQADEHAPALTCLSYHALQPVRAALLKKMQTEIQSGGMGPETLRTILARLRPEDLHMIGGDPVLNRFQVSLLTEGSGTQVFSTTFAQWAAREGLRRAEPLTLLVRFAPRQRQRPMNELLSETRANTELDPPGSLIDADMGAYYHWLNQQRLPGAEQSSFLVWFEDHNEALAISPALPRGTQSSVSAGIRDLLGWIS
jgi:hypothetical protein